MLWLWQFARTPLVLLGILGALGVGAPARANGRLPATSTITFQHGHENNIAAGATVGSGGMYDPAYAYSASGALFATTFNGLSVTRNGCTFDATPEGKAFVSASTIDPGGAFYFAAAQVLDTKNGIAQDFDIYKSTNDFMTLPTGVPVAASTDVTVWWQSIEVAPSDPKIVYLSGYRYIPKTSGTGTMGDHLLFRSNNGGAAGSWPAMAKTGLVLMPNSVIHIAGIWSNDPAHLYARVEFIDNTTTDAYYVSTDSGATWTEIDRAPNLDVVH